MAQTKYQVTLAIDGKHSVSVASDDPAAVTEGLVWAQDTYKKLLRLRQSAAAPASGEQIERGEVREDAETGAPICAVHQKLMTWVPKNGGFWSCHEKNSDGSWCSWRPPK